MTSSPSSHCWAVTGRARGHPSPAPACRGAPAQSPEPDLEVRCHRRLRGPYTAAARSCGARYPNCRPSTRRGDRGAGDRDRRAGPGTHAAHSRGAADAHQPRQPRGTHQVLLGRPHAAPLARCRRTADGLGAPCPSGRRRALVPRPGRRRPLRPRVRERAAAPLRPGPADRGRGGRPRPRSGRRPARPGARTVRRPTACAAPHPRSRPAGRTPTSPRSSSTPTARQGPGGPPGLRGAARRRAGRQAHARAAALLAALGEPSARLGAIPYHLEHGTDPLGAGVTALAAACE